MKNQKAITIIVFGILSLPVIIYVLHFHKLPVGNSLDWSYFGSFYGGILGPIITAITTLLLIKITFMIAKNEENRQREYILSDYTQNIISILVNYQLKLNNIKSQFWVKKFLIESQININKIEYNNLSFFDKGTPEVQKSQQYKQFEVDLSIKLFYADIIYNISEIKAYFENFETNHSLFMLNNYIEKKDFEIVKSELVKLEEFLKKQLTQVNISSTPNIARIESEISKIINLIADNSKNIIKH